MPINDLLKKRGIGPEDSERLKQAFSLAVRGLSLVDRNDPVCEIVAHTVLEIGLNGTRDPREIAAQTIRQLGS